MAGQAERRATATAPTSARPTRTATRECRASCRRRRRSTTSRSSGGPRSSASACARRRDRCTLDRRMTNEDEVFGYQDGGEQLADYAERFGLLFDRLRAIRAVMPEAAAVVPQRVKDELFETAGVETQLNGGSAISTTRSRTGRTSRCSSVSCCRSSSCASAWTEPARPRDPDDGVRARDRRCVQPVRHASDQDRRCRPDVSFFIALLGWRSQRGSTRMRLAPMRRSSIPG